MTVILGRPFHLQPRFEKTCHPFLALVLEFFTLLRECLELPPPFQRRITIIARHPNLYSIFSRPHMQAFSSTSRIALTPVSESPVCPEALAVLICPPNESIPRLFSNECLRRNPSPVRRTRIALPAYLRHIEPSGFPPSKRKFGVPLPALLSCSRPARFRSPSSLHLSLRTYHPPALFLAKILLLNAQDIESSRANFFFFLWTPPLQEALPHSDLAFLKVNSFD